jgi:hypothetical protein
MPKKQKLSSLINDLNNEFWPSDLDDDLVEIEVNTGEYIPDSNELIADSLEVGGL